MRKISSALIICAALCVSAYGAVQDLSLDGPRLSLKGREAYRKLLAAEMFRVGGMGYGGVTSDEEFALYDLLDEKEAAAALKRLAGEGTYEGALYGLLGLKVMGAGEFKDAVAAYRGRGTPQERAAGEYMNVPAGKVVSQSGCVIGFEDWEGLVSQIESGHYDDLIKRGRENREQPRP